MELQFRKVLLFFFCGAYLPIFAQQPVIPERLDEVIIGKSILTDSLLRVPLAIAILNAKDLQRNNTTDIATGLNMAPGLYMQTANFTTNRITIRGIGARTPFGTNKIRAFYGSIPLTSGNSETTIEDIDPETIGSIEVIKGPMSSLYGAGLGGALLINPKYAPPHSSSLTATTVHGSYGLSKQRIGYAISDSTWSANVSYHRLASDGWRQNSAYDREGLTIAAELLKTKTGSMHLLASHTYLKAFIPSSINRSAFANDPRAAAATWLAAKGYKRYTSALAGLSYDWQVSPSIKNSSSVFVNYRDNYETRPFDILGQYTTAAGARTQFSNIDGTDAKFAYIVGVEYFNDDFSGTTSENLYADNNGNGSLEGLQLSGTAQNRQFYNGFAQFKWELSDKIELQGGLNVNETRFDLSTDFPEESRRAEQYRYKPIWAPQLALSYYPKNNGSIYLSVSRGFSLPAVEETLMPDGSINTGIRPESGYNIEAGSKWFLIEKKLYIEMTAYSMQIRDLLVAKRVADDQYVGVNAGNTSHSGIELFAKANLSVSTVLISPFVSLSAGRYTFTNFKDGDNDFSGNRLTGVPANKLNTGITIETKEGSYLHSDFQFVDGFALNDANTEYSSSYRLLNIKAGQRISIIKGLKADAAFGINNLGREHYASMVLVNAAGFGGTAPRYYYPGLPINYYANLSVSYLF